jgi:hypothetical protein
MGSLAHYTCCGKEMLEKMAILESTLGGGRFFASGSTVARNSALICSNPYVPGKDCSTVFGNGSWDNAHTSDLSNMGKRLGNKSNTLVQHAQHTGGSSGG